MGSLRECAGKFAKNPSLVIGMRVMAQDIGMMPPFSLQDLVDSPSRLDYPRQPIDDDDDVHGWYELSLYSTGRWSLSGHLYDEGWVMGDKFRLVVHINIEETQSVLAWEIKGDIDHKSNYNWNEEDFSGLIRLNWTHLQKGKTALWHLSTSADAGDLWDWIGLGAAAIFFLTSASQCKKWVPDPEVGGYRCEY